jgi:D-amino-acid dehydrogenase
MSSDHVAVIGAGITGVATALWLQRAGARVTLIDKEGPAAGASYGNAGVLAAGSVVPVTVPGLLRKAPGMLFDSDQPLFLRWRYLPRMLSFLPKYLKHATQAHVDRISRGLFDVLHDSADQHLSLSRGTKAEPFVKEGSYLFGYKDRAAFEADAFAWNIRRARGLPFNEMSADDLAAFDQALEGRFGYGVECLGHGQITDPGAYINALAESFAENGGALVRAAVTGFREERGRAVAALTDTGDIAADTFVITTGAWSDHLAKSLGVSVPLEAERGYHMEYHNPSIALRAPIMVASGKFVASPMRGRLRCAGIVEFGGLTAGPSKAPLDLMKRTVEQIFPDLQAETTTTWLGHRPATADSLPVIGASPRIANIWLGYGHQHVGLTGGPKTGRWLAQLITGQAVNTDLAPFSPSRKV